MPYYLSLRLLAADHTTLLYERHLPLSALKRIASGYISRFLETGMIERANAMRVIVQPNVDEQPSPIPEVMPSEPNDNGDLLIPTGIAWLGLKMDDRYRPGQPMGCLTLRFVVVPLPSQERKTIVVNAPLSQFGPWFEPARSFLVQLGKLEPQQAVVQQVAVNEDDGYSEQERIPALDEQVRQMEGELEAYDVRDLKPDAPPSPKRKCQLLNFPREDSLAVFVRQSVMAELEMAAKASFDHEIGGLLVGQAHRDIETEKLFIKIQAHIPARFALSERDQLRFSHEDNLQFSLAMEGKYKNQRTLGWYHTHPDAPFLSAHDYNFHSTTWSAPWHVALVLGHGGQTKLVFYWNGDQLITLSNLYLY